MNKPIYLRSFAQELIWKGTIPTILVILNAVKDLLLLDCHLKKILRSSG